ncbi:MULTISPECIES: hypothetical protein [Acidianus]|uniref:Uncharacterized protein n=1 Tax=Candidatus Acidianus copahuensis TaxID=1160895 RepID=A0A031LTL0_9CREN|nr:MULTISPECIES: hypothetical protein [Acidianus]EZQ11070.1 hypothetical protein CM19_02405 [Candidatus Acidianus copahuensis]
MSRRTIIYAVIFSVASYAVAAGLALAFAAYAISVFTDPIVTLTIPLIIISIGVQAINKKNGPLLILLISALLYLVSGLIFLVPTFMIAGIVVELVSRLIGYRSFKAVMINTILAGSLAGIFSVVFGVLFIPPKALPFSTFVILLSAFSGIYLVESTIMGGISYYLGSYLIKSGVIKDVGEKKEENPKKENKSSFSMKENNESEKK